MLDSWVNDMLTGRLIVADRSTCEDRVARSAVVRLSLGFFFHVLDCRARAILVRIVLVYPGCPRDTIPGPGGDRRGTIWTGNLHKPVATNLRATMSGARPPRKQAVRVLAPAKTLAAKKHKSHAWDGAGEDSSTSPRKLAGNRKRFCTVRR